jgi:hypothetical protein
MIVPVKCPLCGRSPVVEPTNPKRQGEAWGEVRCRQDDHCFTVSDGTDVADGRGSDAYKAMAIARWNGAMDRK